MGSSENKGYIVGSNNNNNNNKSGFKEPSSNQTPLKTVYNDGKKKDKKSEKNIYIM